MIGLGIIFVDHNLDNNINGNLLGSILFAIGWVYIAFTVSLNKDNVFSTKMFIRRGIPALLILVSATWAQNVVINTKNVENRFTYVITRGGMPFMAMWMLFTSLMVYSGDNDKKYRAEKRLYFFGGFALIALGMMFFIF